jgi:hypothetical protein
MQTLLNHLDRLPHGNGEPVLLIRTELVELEARRIDAKRYIVAMFQLDGHGQRAFERSRVPCGDPEGVRLVAKELLKDAHLRPRVDPPAESKQPARARPGAAMRASFEAAQQRRAAERKA